MAGGHGGVGFPLRDLSIRLADGSLEVWGELEVVRVRVDGDELWESFERFQCNVHLHLGVPAADAEDFDAHAVAEDCGTEIVQCLLEDEAGDVLFALRVDQGEVAVVGAVGVADEGACYGRADLVSGPSVRHDGFDPSAGLGYFEYVADESEDEGPVGFHVRAGDCVKLIFDTPAA